MKTPLSSRNVRAILRGIGIAWIVLAACAANALAAADRPVWAASRVRGTPEPPPPFALERAFPGLTFTKPMEAATIPGTHRVLLLEQAGRLLSFDASDPAPNAETVLDLHDFEPRMRDAFALTFHPRFTENRFVYVMLAVLEGKNPTLENGSRIVRFTLPDTTPTRIDPRSGVTLLSWTSGGHNGCGIRFGPDGMLYISTGDAAPPEPPDAFQTGQNLDDLLCCILRIDVDRPRHGLGYGIPADNPFVHTAGARGEIWAYGLRNPWRIAFDRATGELYAGDVGWERWEMIHRIVRGGNSGWSITEATRQEVYPERKQGPTPIRPPLAAHPHEEAASITGGEFYHGKRHPELAGSYIYADWQMGTFWALRAEGDRVLSSREIARSALMPVGFATLPDDEILACDHAGGGLWRLVPNTAAGKSARFPRRLSETGLFGDTPRQTPAEGVRPYALTVERWNDHATAQRWIGIPSAEDVTAAKTGLGVQRAGRWIFPENTVLAKTYSLEFEAGNAASRRPVETQLLHFSGAQPAAYTYRWNDSQTDAELVAAEGMETQLQIRDASAPGGTRHQTWRFHSRSECMRCHTLWNDFTPGYNALHLAVAGDKTEPGQIAQFAALGLVPSPPRSTPSVPAASGLERTARGAIPTYLDVELSVGESRLIDQPPAQGDLGLPEGRIIAPGDPARSVLLYRMASTGRGHMPYLGSHLADETGLRKVRDWIASLAPDPGKISPQTFAQREAERAHLAALQSGTASPDALDTLLRTSSGALSVALALLEDEIPAAVRELAIQKGYASADPFRANLFERFLGPERKRKTLGARFDAGPVLSKNGDVERGKRVFESLCAGCHRVNESGVDFGPDLRSAARRYSAAELLEHIRNPSLLIEPAWQLSTLTLGNGETKAGFVTRRTAQEITLRTPGGLSETFAPDQIKSLRSETRISAMPENLLQFSTGEEAADLLAWLKSLAVP
jgi:putative heme-binding domain-containing protein